MLDFLEISIDDSKKGVIEITPSFIYMKSNDLMIRGGDFYAIWVEERNMWSTDESDAVRLIDNELRKFTEEYKQTHQDRNIKTRYLRNTSSGSIDKWLKYCQKQSRDNYHMLDEKIIFSNTKAKKRDYSSKALTYPLEPGSIEAYDKLMSTLYSPEERHKIEWAIGSIVSGDSKKIQKFMVLYGAAGTGKSTVLNIIQLLFDGYYSVFDAKALGVANNSFALEPFKTNPLVAIQHDGDLSKIEDNTRLNSLVSHELMPVNEKFKSVYSTRFKAFLFMGTNKPVKITDGKSGLLRRLIDVTPSGNKLTVKEYKAAMNTIEFELGAIADHCLNVYLSDPGFYDTYVPNTMLGATNDFYNFVVDSYSVFLREDGTSLKAAYEMYKAYCDDARVQYPYPRRAFKEELKNYFWEFNDRFDIDGTRVRSYYSGFRTDKFEIEKKPAGKIEENNSWLKFESQESIFDQELKDAPAQYASDKGTPVKKWENVKTTLADINTSELHYVRVPQNHIVIDFDLKDKDGNKSLDLNTAAASKWPKTYAEVSKSGNGIHLHYIYTGDPSKLSRIYDDNIEVKVFTGASSLRRKLTLCNNIFIANISSGLRLKGDDNVVSKDVVQTEKGLRTTIKKCLSKDVHAGTKSNIDFIYKILEDAYNSGLHYDVTDLRNDILIFGANSTHQADYCIKLINRMKFKSDDPSNSVESDSDKIIFYDIEVFPNLFLVNWKFEGEGKPVVRMINPSPSDIEDLLRYRLIGFNNRRYDNHLIYARLMGYTNEQLYNLSQKIISSQKGENGKFLFGEAYNLSYTDVYDFAAKKQSLKKWEIELGIHHQELGLPWDQPVPEELWPKVAEYCDNDVIATEAVFNHCKGDFLARQILADLAGGSVNDTTNSLTTKIIFGKEKHPDLVYTDLATGEQHYRGEVTQSKALNSFPGYECVYSDVDKKFHNIYRGTDVGMGGYVYSKPGMYGNVALLDVASLHPNSIRAMNCFGEHTKNFTDIIDARVAIKHGDLDLARQMLNGRLAPYLKDESAAKDLAQALKIAINSVYGLTSAGFNNPFRDERNKNNIVALRGALFMRTLQDEVEQRGYIVAHIKTDSIKIPDADDDIIQFVMDFGQKYGYTFEHEATYEKMCLVNDAVYIAKYKDGKHAGEWTATGKQFAVPYVFKKLFSREDILFQDLCETFSVSKGDLYLDMNENLPDVSIFEKEKEKYTKDLKKGLISESQYDMLCTEVDAEIAKGHDYIFVGRVGQFCPIKPGGNGGVLYRCADGKYYAAAGTKGYRWVESELVMLFENNRNMIDFSYYDKLVDDAVETMSAYGDVEWFISDDPYVEDLPFDPD